MNVLELVNWDRISFQELDTLLMISGHSGHSSVDMELCNRLTPLCIACKLNREDLVTVLLHQGAKPNRISSFYGRYPVHFACDHNGGNLGIVRKLLEAEAEINVLDSDGNSGLHLACTESNVPVVKLLIDSHADVHVTDVDGETPLVRACYAKSVELIDILLQAGSNPNVPQGQPLEIAVRAPSVEIFKLLMEAGADINKGAYLSHASEHDHIDMMKILHNYGADVNKANILGMTPLQTACFSSQASLTPVRLLLHWGASVDTYSKMNETALHYACISQDLNKVRLLLAYRADVNPHGCPQLSPLMMALSNPANDHSGSWSDLGIVIVRLLLSAGAILSAEKIERLRSAICLLASSSQKRQELLCVLDDHASQPTTLQDLCRLKIRKVVHPNIDDHVGRLPLPAQVISYLRFFDVIGDYVTYSL